MEGETDVEAGSWQLAVAGSDRELLRLNHVMSAPRLWRLQAFGKRVPR
jgi:hypothetical protein